MRTGHGTVGKLVAECEGRNCQLKDLSLDDLQAACDLIDESVYDVLGTRNAVAALQSFGSGGKAPVEEQITYWQTQLQS